MQADYFLSRCVSFIEPEVAVSRCFCLFRIQGEMCNPQTTGGSRHEPNVACVALCWLFGIGLTATVGVDYGFMV